MLCVKAKRDQPAMLNVNLKRGRRVQQSRLLSATAAAHDLLLTASYPEIYLCSQQHYPHLPHSLSLFHFLLVFLVFQINAVRIMNQHLHQ